MNRTPDHDEPPMSLKVATVRSPLEVVEPGTPEFLPSMPSGPAVDRLMFARWLVDPQNPLTARVQANRIWERFFGRGLVETQEDFGTQGKPPANQMLLDHLAQRFVELQWSWKALCKEILTSATYQQSSRNREDLAAMDPDNLLLARASRFRARGGSDSRFSSFCQWSPGLDALRPTGISITTTRYLASHLQQLELESR